MKQGGADGQTTDARYSARLTKASLKVPEARLVAQTLLSSKSPADALRKIVETNLLQKRSPSTSRTLASILVTRLTSLDSAAWLLVAEGGPSEATLAVMACAVKAERLLADFMDWSLRDSVRTYARTMDGRGWPRFIEECAARDSRVLRWTPTVIAKLRENTHRILAEAGYVADTRSLRLQHVHVPDSVANLLVSMGEDRVLRILRVAE